MAGNNDDNRAAYNNAVFHDIIQHYDDEARPDHDDIDYEPASLDDLDGTEYDQHGVAVILVDPDIIANISAFIIAVYEHNGVDGLPDSFQFFLDETCCDDCDGTDDDFPDAD